MLLSNGASESSTIKANSEIANELLSQTDAANDRTGSNLRLVPRDAILRNGGGASEVGYRGAFSDTFGHEVCEYLRENEDR